jgi:hypothetical protein
VSRAGLTWSRVHSRAAVDVLGVPRADVGRVRDGSDPGLRRGRGDGLDRSGEPGHGRAEGARRPLRRPGGLGARAVPAGHDAGVECRPVGEAAPLGRAGHGARREHRGRPSAVRLAARLCPYLRRRPSPAELEWPGISFAVENMYPLRVRGREFVPYVPGWDPSRHGFDAYTLDLSHCAAARTDALAMADTMGPGLRHVHLGDGTGDGRTSTWYPDAVPSPAPSCCPRWTRAASPAPSRARWRHPAGTRPARPGKEDHEAGPHLRRHHLGAAGA